MKIALASSRIINRDFKYNLSQMERYIIKAQKNGANLVCFGETFLQSFDSLTWRFDSDKDIAITTNSKVFKQIQQLSVKYEIDILFGYIELNENSLYSSCALISSGKLHHNYRRISKGWKEYTQTDEHYQEGSTVEVFNYKGKKCVIALCGDLWDYPVCFNLGEDLLFWPVYVSYSIEEWENKAKTEYAKQAVMCCPNTMYINSICEGDAFGGVAFFEDGLVKKELPINNEGILIIEV